ncbi:LpqB family beta-propeller domain-containing protein [Paractinoplanes rhizophilus]|uniref:LpqB family beta-propeller domain-containing protein n=1 Tax=Paractinoplanes rhizophilus TaxID=1416877 RepID=A0ABW2HUQ1_9ACTN|nr:LpqB family beta-propeller domain-containing protein [Actinoplanes sp.]
MRRLFAVVTLAALLLGGCGIPDETKVTVVGPGPTVAPGGRDNTVPAVRNTRNSANTPSQLVSYYLEAAAGEPDGAVNRAKAFMSDDAKAKFHPDPEVKVIRMKGIPLVTPGDPEITFNAQAVGMLKGNGVLEPSVEAPKEYKLRVGQIAGQSGYFVLDSPNVLLLTDTALDNFYARRTIYFWNTEDTSLVPDLRYMPLDVPSDQQPTTILSWLVNGPASWLNDVAHGLPSGTVAPDNVPAPTNGIFTVTLSAQAVPAGDVREIDRLRRQLQWSLREGADPFTLELKIGHQAVGRYSDDDYLSSNPAYRLAGLPERFTVYGGVIRRLAKSAQPGAPIPVLKPEENKNISVAAMSTSSTHTYAAVVVGSGKNAKLKVAAARTGQQAALKEVGGISGALGRPVWAVTTDGDPSGAVGLITVNGKLYSFGPGGSPAVPVASTGVPGPITAISVAPDGYRVALVSGGQLYRTTLKTGGDAPTMSKTVEQILAPGFSRVAAAAWSSETYLAVAGVRDDSPRYAVVDVSVDGAVRYTRLDDVGKGAITYLTAYPANPVTKGENADNESYEVAGVGWDVLTAPERIGTDALAGPTASPQPGVVPTAPFFLD